MPFIRLRTSLTINTPMMQYLWIEELQLESPSPIIAYKPQGIVKADYPSLQESTFFLVLMKSFQADMFKEFIHWDV